MSWVTLRDMTSTDPGFDALDHMVIEIFALVSEALSRATHVLLSGDALLVKRSSTGTKQSIP